MRAKVFYSWQSETKPAAANRYLIEDALKAAAEEIAADGSIGIEPVIDRDTQFIPGSPDIGTTILGKIKEADAFVADVTLINRGPDVRPTPNPNVMLELGYAIATLTESRILLVQNLAFGPIADLPFDLRQKRVLTYDSAPDTRDRAGDRRKLQAVFREAIPAILALPGKKAQPAYPVDLKMSYDTVSRLTGRSGHVERHDYKLNVIVTNRGTDVLTDWELEIEFPKAMRPPSTHLGAEVPMPPESDYVRLRTAFDGKRKLYPDESYTFGPNYIMNDELLRMEDTLFKKRFRARIYVNGKLVREVEKTAGEMQQF